MRVTRRTLLGGLGAALAWPGAAGAAILPREDDAAKGQVVREPARPTPPPYPPLPAGSRPFADGESLEYEVEYQGISAGDASLTVLGPTTVDGLSGLLVRYTAQTRGLVARFYRLDDRIESLLDPLFLFTRRTETWSQQRSRYRHRVVRFEPGAGRFVRREIPGDTITGPLDTPVVDGLGLVYHLRVKPLAPGSRLTVPVYRKQEVTAVTFEARGPVLVGTPAGRFETIEIFPVEADGRSTEEGGLFGGRGRIWLTTDERRVPVRLAGSAAVGSLDARLRQVLVSSPVSAR
ncbi:MAG TPA: DUF3108 domain-containing protein [Thermodesulfobacteriota bacterium]